MKIEITPEMIEAGLEELYTHYSMEATADELREAVKCVFSAMIREKWESVAIRDLDRVRLTNAVMTKLLSKVVISDTEHDEHLGPALRPTRST